MHPIDDIAAPLAALVFFGFLIYASVVVIVAERRYQRGIREHGDAMRALREAARPRPKS